MSVSRQQRAGPGRMLEVMSQFLVIPIPPRHLDAIREAGKDEHGNALLPYAAAGWEPLRCCLRIAPQGERIALISYSPFTVASPWAEVGPVYVHAESCAGYLAADLPPELRTGPRILRTYHSDESLDYDDIAYVPSGEDIAPALRELLSRPAVAAVHVRPMMTQCFLYEVRGAI
jgi:hypothetical protein